MKKINAFKMNPILFIAVALGLAKFLVDFFSGNPEFEEIDHDDIYKDFLIEEDQIEIDEKILKQKITRGINVLIKEYKGFKIGKTGNPKGRTGNHKKYKKMFLLCSTNSKELNKKLEGYYNTKYIEHKKNDNKKEGSAGEAKAVNGRFYLYVVVR